MTSESHYFDATPGADSKPRIIEVTLPDVFLRLRTDSGVFSADRLDPGTSVLLRHHPVIGPEVQTLLDLGCGYGPIALSAAKRAPWATVLGVDVNQRALGLARTNAIDNECPSAAFEHVDDVDPERRFDLILSNPPIRIGKAALHELLETWLDRLTPEGRAHLVVQKHLGADSLARWLTTNGWHTERLMSQKAFRLLEVRAR